MAARPRYNGRHRTPGRHRAPRRSAPVSFGTALRVTPVVAVVGVSLVATAPQPTATVQGASTPDPADTGTVLGLLALRGDPPAAARSRTRQSPRDAESPEATAAASTAVAPTDQPAAVAVPPPAPAPAPAPAKAPAKAPAPAVVPAIQTGAQFAGAAQGIGLRGYAITVYCAVRATFGITTIGGYRAGDPGDHGTGHAVDVMITGKDQGDAVAAFVMAHAAELHVKYVIWRQRIWTPGGTWRPMADRGSITANHYDHVHVSVNS